MGSDILLENGGTQKSFPIDNYLRSIVRILDTIKYNDQNYTALERRDKLHYAYVKAAKHFAQPEQQRYFNTETVQAAVKTCCMFVVYSYGNVSNEVVADLTIICAYITLLDDTFDNPSESMRHFFHNMQAGKPQDNVWWRMVNEQALPQVISHYNPYCAFNIYRSTLDFFQGCWIEQYKFQGYPRLCDYPNFLRRLSGYGQWVGASFFPKNQFDEKALFREITAVIAQVEHWSFFINDVFSFYKEFSAERDQVSLIRNYAKCDETTTEQALEKLTEEIIVRSEQLLDVFHDKDPRVSDSVKKFMQGLVTWYFSDPRYRIHEIVALIGDRSDEVVIKFLAYQKHGQEVGCIQGSDWAYPTVVEYSAEHKNLSL